MQEQGGCVLSWSIAIYWVRRLWSFPGGGGQGHPNFCSAGATPPEQIKQSEMAAMCAGLGGYQSKPSYGSRLAAASARLGAH